MTATHLASRDVLAAGSSQVVVGRHTSCDAVLEGDASIALRHLLIRSTILDDGCPRLSVLDLETDGGFFLPGRQARAIHLCGRTLRDPRGCLRNRRPAGWDPLAGAAARSGLRPRGRSTPGPVSPAGNDVACTLGPRAAMLADRPTLAVMPQAEPPVRDYELTLSAAQTPARSTYEAELERGLLVGRALKCLDAGSIHSQHGDLSRPPPPPS